LLPLPLVLVYLYVDKGWEVNGVKYVYFFKRKYTWMMKKWGNSEEIKNIKTLSKWGWDDQLLFVKMKIGIGRNELKLQIRHGSPFFPFSYSLYWWKFGIY